jgi:hypothetical protein
MSPLRILLLKVLRGGALAAAVFAALVLAIEVWKHGGDVTALNPGFMIMLAIMLAGALWLARAIKRELVEHGS